MAAAAAVLPAVRLLTLGRSRRRYRLAHNLCARCGYDLTANVSGLCPECGRPVPAGQAEAIRKERERDQEPTDEGADSRPESYPRRPCLTGRGGVQSRPP